MGYTLTEIWDSVAAQIFEGAGAGTDMGHVGLVTITKEDTYHDVKSSQTGQQILDRRVEAITYRVAIDFKQPGAADYFKNWWLDGYTDTAGIIDLHEGSTGGSVPTKRIRVHPKNLGADTSKDWVFEKLAMDKPPAMTLNGTGEHVHRFEFIALPDPAQLPTLDLGQFNAGI